MDVRESPVANPNPSRALHGEGLVCSAERPARRERRAHPRRTLRLRVGLVDLDGRIVASGRLRDLSTGGCRIDGLPLGEARFEWGDFTPLMPDTIVSLSIETLPTLIRGRIAWRRNRVLGVQFTKVPLQGVAGLQRLAEGIATAPGALDTLREASAARF